MYDKDYYKILGVPPSASLPEIRKAYRKLAQQYHPDKNQGDPYAASQFTEIKEAYEVLTDPIKKSYYLQQRWYDQSQGKSTKRSEALTPADLLKQCLALRKQVATLDIFRMDKEGLLNQMEDMLSDATIEKILAFGETEINRQATGILLKICDSLNYRQSASMSRQLFKLAGDNEDVKLQINAFLRQKQQQEKWEKFKPFLLLLITLLLCMFIYFATR